MSGFASDDLTQDAYLGGKLHLWQPRRGYRAGVDAVLLAASVPATPRQSVLDLGCGAGAAVLCLGARVDGLALTGVEREPAFAELATRNADENRIPLEVVTADLADLPSTLRAQQFDHVLANPPFFDRGASRPSQNPLREAAHAEQTPLATWIRTAGKRLTPKGMLHVIHRAERLPDLLAAMPQDIGSIEVLPIASRSARPAERFILRAKKNGRADFVLHPALIMHSGAQHVDDRIKDYSAPVQAVLGTGAALLF